MFKDKRCFVKIISFMAVVSLCTSHITFASEGDNGDGTVAIGSKTITVEYGEYVEKTTLKGITRNYLRSDTLYFKKRGYLVEYIAKDGATVLKGEKIAAYEPIADQVAVEESTIRLEQTKEVYAKQLKQKETNIEETLEAISEMDQSLIEAQIMQINLTKARLELEQYKIDMKKTIADLEDKLEEEKEKVATQYLVAPYDCIFSSNERWFRPGTLLETRHEIGYIKDVNTAILESKSTNLNKLWYGMKLSLTDTSGFNQGTVGGLTGKVVTADSLFNGKLTTEMIYIQLDDPSLLSTVQKVDMLTDTVKIQDVIVIPLSTVKYKDEVAYVYVLGEDGSVYKQYLNGRNNGSSMWVYSGLSVGQKIIAE